MAKLRGLPAEDLEVTSQDTPPLSLPQWGRVPFLFASLTRFDDQLSDIETGHSLECSPTGDCVDFDDEAASFAIVHDVDASEASARSSGSSQCPVSFSVGDSVWFASPIS